LKEGSRKKTRHHVAYLCVSVLSSKELFVHFERASCQTSGAFDLVDAGVTAVGAVAGVGLVGTHFSERAAGIGGPMTRIGCFAQMMKLEVTERKVVRTHMQRSRFDLGGVRSAGGGESADGD
jgi:hypothetical protein